MSTDNQPARMLGDRYSIGVVIGRGGMADVHEGRDLRLGRRVAIKILRSDLARDPSFHARFRREAQSAAALNHPNIVAVYDTGEEELSSADGTSSVVPFIVMEYVDGMTLRQLLASGRRLLPERALEITAGILSALDYAHRHGIVHRDIKPANVMLTRTGEVKVMDFGIARAINEVAQSMTTTSTVMGTAQYLSPEQARGEVVDARSDLYSTGVLLYELLTGKPPFTGDSPVSIAYQHVSEMPLPPSQVDPGVLPDVDAVVLHALAKRVEDRYQTAVEFRGDVERAIVGGPLTAAVPVISGEHTAELAPIDAAGVRNYQPMYDLSRKRTSRGRALWVFTIIGIAAAIIGALLIGRFVFFSGGAGDVTVPNLSGLTVEQASALLTEVGLNLGAQTPESSDRPKGTIIAQQPASGDAIQRGQSVNVTISSGLEQITVPALVALSSADSARQALNDAGLNLGAVVEQPSTQPAGYVLAQDPAAGAQVDSGSAVNITVSSGQVTVPNVVGASEAQARSDLAQAGFDTQVVVLTDATALGGTVLAQSPQAGQTLARGSVVTISVAASLQPTAEPGPVTTASPPPVDPAAPASPSPSKP